MNYKVKNKVIEAIVKGQPLYIKDTGVKVAVEYFGSDLNINEYIGTRGKSQRQQYCNINFIAIPTTKSLKLMAKFHVREGDNPGTTECKGMILLDNLSLTPYETKAAKVLFKKDK